MIALFGGAGRKAHAKGCTIQFTWECESRATITSGGGPTDAPPAPTGRRDHGLQIRLGDDGPHRRDAGEAGHSVRGARGLGPPHARPALCVRLIGRVALAGSDNRVRGVWTLRTVGT